MRRTLEYDENHVYLLTNSQEAEKMVIGFIDDFMDKHSEGRSFIFISYSVADNIILLHFKGIDNECDFNYALKKIKEDIEKGNLYSDDVNLKKH